MKAYPDKVAKESEIYAIAYNVPIQPLTQLSEEDYARVLEVRSYITEGRWDSYAKDQDSLTRFEQNSVFQVADQLYGSRDIFNQVIGDTTDFEQDQQTQIDTLSRAFIALYKKLDKSRIVLPFDAVAEILRMPLTTVSSTLGDRIGEIIFYRLPNRLWERRFYAFTSEKDPRLNIPLSQRQIDATDRLGLEVTGDVDAWRAWSIDQIDLTQKQQRIVDASFEAFVKRYENLEESDIIEIIAEIERMPLTTITERTWAQI